MSDFTKGKWQYSEYVPEGVTLNGTEYLIKSGNEEIALVATEADARLITTAPEFYQVAVDFLAGKYFSPCVHEGQFSINEEFFLKLKKLTALAV